MTKHVNMRTWNMSNFFRIDGLHTLNIHMSEHIYTHAYTHLYIHMSIGLYVYSFIHIHVHGCVCMSMCVYTHHLHEALKLHQRLRGSWSTKYPPFGFHALRSIIYWKLCQRQQTVGELRNRNICSTKIILKMYLPKFYLTMRIHGTSYQDKILRKQWYRTTVIPQLCSRES